MVSAAKDYLNNGISDGIKEREESRGQPLEFLRPKGKHIYLPAIPQNALIMHDIGRRDALVVQKIGVGGH